MNDQHGGEPAEMIPVIQLETAIFAAKATMLQAKRAMLNVKGRIRRHARKNELLPHILAESRSPLWHEADTDAFELQLGRIQNLRCAVDLLNGTHIPAGEIFSFWKQIGRATRRRGFATGRLLREGCLIPATGGGLCQLSNALYDVALRSEMHVLERWPHSRMVPGSSAAIGRDATVAWNYIDLRFRARFEWQIEAILTRDELIVRMRGTRAPLPDSRETISLASDSRPILDPVAHSCASCGAEKCFRHKRQNQQSPNGRTFYVVDEYWPEFQAFIDSEHARNAGIAVPIDGEFWNRPSYRWQIKRYRHIVTATLPALQRGRQMRRLKGDGAERLQAELDANRAIAIALARRLPIDALHLVVAQPLLPWLWISGFLGGRTFDVMMTQMPLSNLHDILDDAHALHPERDTLSEFRAPQYVVQAETAALAAAGRLVTPHAAIAALFPEQAVKIPWQLSAHGVTRPASFTIAFPGPTAARNGSYEVRHAARALRAEVVLGGAELEGIGYWAGIKTRRVATEQELLDGVSVVVQPALIQNRPRHLLTALASGVPVIASPACGLEPHSNLILVPPGDSEMLYKALSLLREKMHGADSSGPGRDNEPKT